MGILSKLFGKRGKAPEPGSDLATALVAELRAQGVTCELRVEGDRLKIDEGDGAIREIYLGNLADEYAAAHATMKASVLAKYARLGARPARVAGADLRSRVLPKLMPRRERELLRMRFGADVQLTNLLPGIELAGGDLVVELAVDEPEAIRLVTESDLLACKLSLDEAQLLARSNLRARSSGPWTRVAPGLLASPWGDFWDGSRLVLRSLIRGLPIKGDPIVVLPNRCSMLVTGSEEPEGLRLLYPAARQLMAKERPLYLNPLRLDGDTWRQLEIAADVEIFKEAPSVMFLSSLQDSLDHEICGEHVRELLAARGFTSVAGVKAVELDNAPTMTVTQCGDGERVAIPKADMVVFDSGATPSMLAWYKVEAMLGDDLVPLDTWPPYFEIRRKPALAELERLRVGAGK